MGDAPSMSAASVRSLGIVCKPASIMTMLYPSQAHMINKLREIRAHHTSSSQGMGDKLAYLRSTFNKPFCFSKRMRKANPAATMFVMKGRKIKVRKKRNRSEEHTSELQSPCNLVCRLLLEKKNICKRYTQISGRT